MLLAPVAESPGLQQLGVRRIQAYLHTGVANTTSSLAVGEVTPKGLQTLGKTESNSTISSQLT